MTGRPSRRIFTSGAAAALLLPKAARAFVLVTEADMQAAPLAKGMFSPPAARDPEAPVITVVEPAATSGIKAPLTIRLAFSSPAGRAIDPRSFRALYGLLGIDITDRLAKYATVTAGGLIATNAEIPKGSHSITLEIKDSAGKLGKRDFDFTVA